MLLQCRLTQPPLPLSLSLSLYIYIYSLILDRQIDTCVLDLQSNIVGKDSGVTLESGNVVGGVSHQRQQHLKPSKH